MSKCLCFYSNNTMKYRIFQSKKKDGIPKHTVFSLAEMEGFEPPVPESTTDFESASLRPLRYISIFLTATIPFSCEER